MKCVRCYRKKTGSEDSEATMIVQGASVCTPCADEVLKHIESSYKKESPIVTPN